MPDTSIYQHVGQGNQLDLGRLLGMAQAARELQTQGAVSDALRASGGDVEAARQSLLRPGGPGFVSPHMLTEFAHASQATSDTAADQMRKFGEIISPHLDDPDLDHNKIAGIANMAVRARIAPPDVAANFISTLPQPTGNKAADHKALQTALTSWTNVLTGGQPPGFGSLPGQAGGGIPITPGRAAFVGRGLAPAPGAAGSLDQPIPGPGGAPLSTAPTGAGSALEAGSAASKDLLASVKTMPDTYANLENLRSLSKEALSGPQTGFEERLNQLGQRFGVNITASAGKLAATEDYAKAAELLVQGSPAYGHSDAFLNNAYGTIPSKELSKLGREGITDWLLGSQDARKFMINSWQQWLAQPGHQAYSNQHLNWLNSKTMVDGSPGFDAANFDPRVFQYARLPTYAKADDGTVINPRAEFTGRMSKTQRGAFVQHLKEYQNNGWVTVGAQ